MRTVKWTKMALVLVIPALALLLLGQSARPPAAEAKPTKLLTISYILCFTLNTDLDWDGSTVVDAVDSTFAFFACQSLNNESDVVNMVRALRELPPLEPGDEPYDDPKPEDFTTAPEGRTPTDSDGGQLHETDGQLWAIAFVSNDSPVAFYADQGVFLKSGRSDIRCGPVIGPDYDINDEDCNGNGVKGDGVVATLLIPKGADRGPATLRVRQDKVEEETEYVVTGEPWNIELTAMKPVIQSGAATCEVFKTTAAFMAALGAPEKTPVTSKVTDSDGTVLTYAQVAYETDDPDMAHLAKPLTPSLVSALGVVAPNVLCGGEGSGTFTLRATISHGVKEGIITNPSARVRHAEVEIKLQGPPTNMVLSASPSSLVCDGTAESTVSATLTDAEGNPAVDGNIVRFDVKALGVASPIEAKSAAGAATTKVKPLTDIARGVAVKATLLLTKGEEVPVEEPVPNPTPTPTIKEISVPDIEKSILVECAAAPGVLAPGAPAAGGAPAISPPATGDGGYLQGG
jgi:hypothetical protein